MSKHLQNLQRLCQKMQARYGDEDDLVVQLKHELSLLEADKSRKQLALDHGRRRQDTARSSIPLNSIGLQ